MEELDSRKYKKNPARAGPAPESSANDDVVDADYKEV